MIYYGFEWWFDYELEFGVWLCGGNVFGVLVSVVEVEVMMFGCSLVNDWLVCGI